MPEHWKYPLAQPEIGSAFFDAILAEDTDKPKAFSTLGRYSNSMMCARAIGYDAAGIAPTDSFDAPSLLVMKSGTILHEWGQAALQQRWPDAEFEVPSQIGVLTSGSCDARFVASILGKRIIWEFKYLGAFKYDQAIGLNRKGYKRMEPKGPDLAHVCQAGMNARANDCEDVVITYVPREAVSVPLANRVGLSSADRIMAEWRIPESVWGPIVDRELRRLDDIRQLLEDGYIPGRQDFDDQGNEITPDPDGQRPFWRCNGYCQWAHECRMDGPGLVPVPVDLGRTA